MAGQLVDGCDIKLPDGRSYLTALPLACRRVWFHRAGPALAWEIGAGGQRSLARAAVVSFAGSGLGSHSLVGCDGAVIL